MSYGINPIFNSTAASTIEDDFLSLTRAFTTATSGGGSTVTNTLIAGHAGGIAITCGAAGGNYAAIISAPQIINDLTNLHYAYYSVVRLPSVGAGFYIQTGFATDETAVSVANQIKFRFNSAENGGRWQCITRAASVETNNNSGITVAINTDYTLAFITSSTSVKFYINGTLVATNTTNIPSIAAGQEMKVVTSAHRLANAGTVYCLRQGLTIY